MAKKKSTTNKKDDQLPDEQQDVQNDSNDHTPVDVEAAYWEEKVKKTTVTDEDGNAKDVEDYVSNIMVVAKPNESSEQLLRRFNREVRDLNLMDDIRERLEYEKPSQKRKRLKRERYLASKQRRYSD